MKYKEAKEFGIECGLEKPYEFVNNIVMHCMSLFGYENIDKELSELIEDAKNNGVKFAKCGDAHKNDTDDLCYICQALKDIK